MKTWGKTDRAFVGTQLMSYLANHLIYSMLDMDSYQKECFQRCGRGNTKINRKPKGKDRTMTDLNVREQDTWQKV